MCKILNRSVSKARNGRNRNTYEIDRIFQSKILETEEKLGKNQRFSQCEILEIEEKFTKLSEFLAKNTRNRSKNEQK